MVIIIIFLFFPAPVASRDGVSRLHFGSATATPLSTRWVFENKIRAKPGETYLFFAKDFSPITFFRSYTLCSTMTSGGHLKRFSSNNSKIQTRVTKILEKQSEKSHWFTKFVINVQCWFYTWRHSSKSQHLWRWKFLSQFIGKLWSRLFNQWGVCSPEIYYPSGCDQHRCEKVFYIESSKPQIVLLLGKSIQQWRNLTVGKKKDLQEGEKSKFHFAKGWFLLRHPLSSRKREIL